MQQTYASDQQGAGIDRNKVAELAEERLNWRFKAVPATAWGRTAREYLKTGPRLSELGTPQLTLDAGALEHNLRTMAAWCAEAGLALAPHGKTTMAPALWQAQLEAGSHGITLANLSQLRVARAFGVQRVLLANPLLDPGGLAWLARELAEDPEFGFVCWVDSVAGVRLMDEALRAAGAERAVEVLVELGGPGGRTGVRDVATGVEVGEAIAAAPTLRLAGVGGYEAPVARDTGAEKRAVVRDYLRRMAELHGRLGTELVTAGGSEYFDLVAEELAPLGEQGAKVVLRSGAYLIHDDGFYRGASPLAFLRPAMHGWARVVSRPEPGLALLDGGKRDFPYDLGLPEAPFSGARVTALNDQHAYLSGAGDEVRIGDTVRLGLSHPCTAFDKWTLIPVVDDADRDDPQVMDLVRTFF